MNEPAMYPPSDHATALADESVEVALVGAAFALAAEKGWNRVSVADAARRAGISLVMARARLLSRPAILRRLVRMADAAALAEVPNEGSPRDRLFDLLMRRIDALQAHRAGVLAMLKGLAFDPATAMLLTLTTQTSMGWMLDAAGIERGGSLGRLSDRMRVKGLVVVWLWTIRAWRSDESLDLTATMAALDTALARAENAAPWLDFRDAKNSRATVPPDADAAILEPA